MKRLLLLLVFLTLGINSSGQDFHPILFKTDVIPVYFDSLAVYEICKLDNTRSHEDLDWCYFVNVDSQTHNMFHISTTFEVDFHIPSCTIKGWVYKKDCVLYMQVDKYDEHGNRWKYLYEKPDSKSCKIATLSSRDNFQSIDEDGQLYVEEMDLTPGSLWVKINFIHEGKQYSGWTERYCRD